jgi:hypothetical protein
MRISGRLFTGEKAKGRTCVRPLLVTRFIRPHPGAQKGGAANLGSLSEPHHEQNPYANPKRTAKTQPIRNIRRGNLVLGSKKSKYFFWGRENTRICWCFGKYPGR